METTSSGSTMHMECRDVVTSTECPPESDDVTQIIPVIGSYARLIFEVVNFVFLSGIICMFGIIANTINIIIFYRQGLDNTINISFFSLAISDLFALITLQFTNIYMNPLLTMVDFPLYGPEVQYLTTSWPHACFGHITCWITAYITAERCLCIALPLKVKQIITPRRTAVLICIMYVANIMPFIPECLSVYIDWKFFPERNRSLLTLAFTEDREAMEGICFVLFALLGFASFPAVILFTAVLVVKLKRQAKWRKGTTRDFKQSGVTSKRDFKTMGIVVLIASVLIVCYTPGVLASIVALYLPGFTIIGTKANLFFVVWSCVFVFEAFNSSVNIFFYYKMSTKYKTMFHEMFGCFCSKDSLMTKSTDSEYD